MFKPSRLDGRLCRLFPSSLRCRNPVTTPIGPRVRPEQTTPPRRRRPPNQQVGSVLISKVEERREFWFLKQDLGDSSRLFSA
jgi:hypothetical protein